MIQFSLKRISTVGPKCGSGGVGWGGVRLSQTTPIPRSPDGDNNDDDNYTDDDDNYTDDEDDH